MHRIISPLVRREILYALKYKRPGHLRHPQTFSEKVNWRILYDRRPLLAWTCDKLRMKEEAARKGVVSPRTYWSGTDIRDLLDVRLPNRWVLKPNHRNELVHFGSAAVGNTDLSALRALTRGWLDEVQASRLGEWAYSRAQRCLLVEEMIGEGDTFPPDYKFFVFDGIPRLIHVHHRRPIHRARVYTPTWNPFPFPCGYAALAPIEAPPQQLEVMLQVAALLGAPFDFMRIDLYSVGETVYLGEYTPYPNGGMNPYWPPAIDRQIGAYWRLPEVHGSKKTSTFR